MFRRVKESLWGYLKTQSVFIGELLFRISHSALNCENEWLRMDHPLLRAAVSRW
jgi:hypothetical protein